MNNSHLKYFFDSAKLRSLQKAALLNHVSPGAVSQGILRLEEEFQVKLLHHSKNAFEMTDAGQLLLGLCPEFFTSLQSLSTRMRDATNPHQGRIYFGTQQSIASTFLPSVLREYQQAHPQVETDFTLGHSSHMKDLLDERKIDFAISMDNLDYENHQKIILLRGNFVFVAASSSTQELQKGFLLTGETEETRKLLAGFREVTGRTAKVRMRIDSWSVIKTMAIEGHGIGFIPDYLIGAEEKKHIYKKLRLPKIGYTVSCVYPETQVLNQRTLRLLEFLKKKLPYKPSRH